MSAETVQWIFDLLAMTVVLAGVGAFSGVMAGLLGVGGGIVIVPALYAALGALGAPRESLMHVSIGTSLACIAVISARAVLSHHRRGGVDWPLLTGWAPWVALGAVIGVAAAGWVETRFLAGMFGLLALVVAAQMALASLGDRVDGRLGAAPPEGVTRAAWGGGIGAISAMVGVGGGALGVLALGLYGVEIRRATAVAAGFGVAIAAPSALGFVLLGWTDPATPPFTLGYVSLIGFALITPLAALSAPTGVRLAHALDARTLRLAFAAFLGVASVGMLREALLGG